MRHRASVIIIENDQVALIKRIRDHSTYYVFPGGGIENGETTREAAIREAYEELGVEVQINECISVITFKGSRQYFFLAKIISGSFGSGQDEEYTDENRDRGTYLPTWVDIKSMSSNNIIPNEVSLKVQFLLD